MVIRLTSDPRPGRHGGLGLIAPLAALALVAAACGGDEPAAEAGSSEGTEPSEAAEAAAAGECGDDVTLVNSIRSLSNEYHANWAQGGEWFAESVGLAENYQVVTDEADQQQQLSTIRSLLAENAACTVINVDPTSSTVTEAVVQAADDAGAYVVSQWNTPDGFLPSEETPTWVSHISFDGRVGGYDTAKALFDEMGGSGQIVAIQGILDNVPAQQRFEGLQQALEEYPDIELLDDQVANWDRAEAQQVTQTLLTQYGDEVTGIWAANDSMALGVVEALRSAGRAGEVPVSGHDATSEALQAISDGEMVATVSSDAWWQGGMGLAIGLAALRGDIDPAELGEEERAFYAEQFLIDGENVEEFLEPPAPDNYEWTDYFGRVVGPIDG